MRDFLHKWLAISLFNLLLVASLGVLLRYKIAFYLPFVEQKYVLHSHSHFAFTGWITQTLMVLMVHYLAMQSGENLLKRYRWLLYANLVGSYGMLVSFLVQGYAFFSISFSTLSIFVSYAFAVRYWKDLNRVKDNVQSHPWFKAALFFSVISSIGAFSLAYMMANKITQPDWYLACIYYFLHFQYNGWFFFAGMGLLMSRLFIGQESIKKCQLVFVLFCFACVPAYFLSVLWLSLPGMIYLMIIAAVVAQLLGWGIFLTIIQRNREQNNALFSVPGKWILILVSIAFSIKLLLQAGSVHPALSRISYGFRPIIIGYLHLVLLAVTSLFIIGYIVTFNLVTVTKKLMVGVCIFITGVIGNELLLLVQGVAAFTYTSIPSINLLLFIAAIILWTGIAIIWISRFNQRQDFINQG